MTIRQAQHHLDRINNELQQLRYHLIGGGIPCLPPANQTTRTEQLVYIHALAAQLVFYYARATPTADAEDVRNCRRRLLASLTFLLHECISGDRTYGHLLQLAELPTSTFEQVLTAARCTPHRFRHFYRAAADTRPIPDLGVAFLLFLDHEKLLRTDILAPIQQLLR